MFTQVSLSTLRYADAGEDGADIRVGIPVIAILSQLLKRFPCQIGIINEKRKWVPLT